jgi:hypothetical protein
MRLKKNVLDTFIISFLMVMPITPTIIAKELVVISYLILIIRILFSKDLFKLINTKLLIFIFFVPGLFFSLMGNIENTLRFVTLLLIILGSPFSNIMIRKKNINFVSLLIILYLVLSQFYLATGNKIFLNFRETWYPFEYGYIFENGFFTDSIIGSIIDKQNWFRPGGLYFNPNTLATLVFLYFLIYDITSSQNVKDNLIRHKKFKKIIYFCVFILVTLSILLTKSRTIIISYSVYLIFSNFNLKQFIKFNITSILTMLIPTAILLFKFTIIYEGIFNYEQSFYLKITLLNQYIQNSDLITLMFGGTFDYFFDMEYGYWIGASGLFSFFGFYIYFKKMIQVVPKMKVLLLSFLLISFGGTLLYNLLNSPILLSLIVVLCSLNHKYRLRNNIYKKI